MKLQLGRLFKQSLRSHSEEAPFACRTFFFFFFNWREQTKYSTSIENWPEHRAAESTVQTDVVRTEKNAALPRVHGD